MSETAGGFFLTHTVYDLCDHDTWTSRTDRRTDGQLVVDNTVLCVASRGKIKICMHIQHKNLTH